MDKILSERDRMRVIKRVESETKGLFRKVLPVSLIHALQAEEGSDIWDTSGATDLMVLLHELVDEVALGGGAPRARQAEVASDAGPGEAAGGAAPDAISPPRAKPARIVMPTRVRPRPLQG